VGQELTDVEADAAGANDGHALAGHFAAFDEVDVVAHLVAVDAGDGGLRGLMPVASTTWSKPPALSVRHRRAD
jgi:hypothetical protein